MCDILGLLISRKEPVLQKPAKETLVAFSKSLGPISASCIMRHCHNTKPASVFLWCNVLWCRYLEWLKTAQQVSPCLRCSVNKAWTHENSEAFTDTSKGSQAKLEDGGGGSGGHLHMQYLKREWNPWSSKTINKGHLKKTVLSKLFSHQTEISPAYQQFLSSKVFHYSCIHYS